MTSNDRIIAEQVKNTCLIALIFLSVLLTYKSVVVAKNRISVVGDRKLDDMN